MHPRSASRASALAACFFIAPILALCAFSHGAESPPAAGNSKISNHSTAPEPVSPQPAEHQLSYGLVGVGLSALGAVVASKKKAKPFIGKLQGLHAGSLPGTGYKNGMSISGVIEERTDQKTKEVTEVYCVDSHIGRITIPKENIDESGDEEEADAPADYEDFKGKKLDAELKDRDLPVEGTAEEKRAALIADDKAKAATE